MTFSITLRNLLSKMGVSSRRLRKVNIIKIPVSDSGIGIKGGDLTRVFEPFAAVDKPSYIKGTGLVLVCLRDWSRLMKIVCRLNLLAREKAQLSLLPFLNSMKRGT